MIPFSPTGTPYLQARVEVSEEGFLRHPSDSTSGSQTQDSQPPEHVVRHVGLTGPHT